ncbi:unnamed protein product [Amoebophrya sp. A25]|nr:unnamed protein product [Amoebophrya sp. A25]|eukprot:GSA25T00021190001.1
MKNMSLLSSRQQRQRLHRRCGLQIFCVWRLYLFICSFLDLKAVYCLPATTEQSAEQEQISAYRTWATGKSLVIFVGVGSQADRSRIVVRNWRLLKAAAGPGPRSAKPVLQDEAERTSGKHTTAERDETSTFLGPNVELDCVVLAYTSDLPVSFRHQVGRDCAVHIFENLDYVSLLKEIKPTTTTTTGLFPMHHYDYLFLVLDDVELAQGKNHVRQMFRHAKEADLDVFSTVIETGNWHPVHRGPLALSSSAADSDAVANERNDAPAERGDAGKTLAVAPLKLGDSSKHKGRLTKFAEIQAIAYRPWAWACQWRLLEPWLNPSGWGHDRYFYDFCNPRKKHFQDTLIGEAQAKSDELFKVPAVSQKEYEDFIREALYNGVNFAAGTDIDIATGAAEVDDKIISESHGLQALQNRRDELCGISSSLAVEADTQDHQELRIGIFDIFRVRHLSNFGNTTKSSLAGDSAQRKKQLVRTEMFFADILGCPRLSDRAYLNTSFGVF